MPPWAQILQAPRARIVRALSTGPQRPNRAPPDFYASEIVGEYAAQDAQRVTIRQLCVFARCLDTEKLLRSANYVRTQLPVRLAHRIRDLQNLPFIVGTNAHVEMVYRLYWEAFELLRTHPPIDSLASNAQFCAMLESMLKKHVVVLPQLVIGLSECAGLLSPEAGDRFLATMLQSRLSRRVLAEHHIRMSEQLESPLPAPHVFGLVNTRCSPQRIATQCAQKARLLYTDSAAFGRLEPPAVEIDGCLDEEIIYIDEHLDFVLFELLKNAVRHTIETGRRDDPDRAAGFAPIRVTLAASPDGAPDFTVRVSDAGGGLPPERTAHPWAFSPASRQRVRALQDLSVAAARAQETRFLGGTRAVAPRGDLLRPPKGAGIVDPMRHLGFGLPLCRLFVEYWGGSVALSSIEGYGTDAYIHIDRFGSHPENP